MIIFYKKQTGEIVGIIEGRIHSEQHLKMWVGSKEENDRIVCNWEVIKKYKDEKGRDISVYEPENNKDVIYQLDQKKIKLKDYKVDIKTKLLIKNS